MRKIDRFDNYMKHKGLNDNKITVQLGLSVGTLGKSRKEGRDLSDRVIEQILNFYTDLNKIWLLTGEGEMLKTDEPKPQTPSVDDTLRDKYLATLELLLAERDKEIKELKHQLFKLKLRKARSQGTAEAEEA